MRDARTGALFRTLRELDGFAVVLAFSPDGSRLLGADQGGALKIWDIATGREIAATDVTGFFPRRPVQRGRETPGRRGLLRSVGDR